MNAEHMAAIRQEAAALVKERASEAPEGEWWLAYPLGILLAAPMGWGFAWGVAALIGYASKTLSSIAFWSIVGFWTFASVRSLVRHIMRQYRVQREAEAEILEYLINAAVEKDLQADGDPRR